MDHHGRHLIMTALGTFETTKGDRINCIPNNTETYMTFNAGQLQFIDSLQFMNSSLEKLAANLQTENLNITSKGLTGKELALLRRKGIDPYECIDNHERFYKLQLPLKEDFYSTCQGRLPHASSLGGIRLQDLRRLPWPIPQDIMYCCLQTSLKCSEMHRWGILLQDLWRLPQPISQDRCTATCRRLKTFQDA